MEKDKVIISDAMAQKGRELLGLLADRSTVWSVSALARQAGLSRYRTERLLASLESGGCPAGPPAELPASPRRAGSVRAAQEAEAVCREPLYRAILRDARPVMESLARRHNEAMYLTMLSGDEVLFLDMVDCHRQERAETFVGRRVPFFSNAAGKVMRAIDSWDLLEKAAKRWGCGQLRYPELAGLKAELELIREQGVAVDCGGMGEGISTVAVAVRDYAGKVVGALTMLGPSFRFLGERLEDEIIPSLLVKGELLSNKFGYVRP